MKKNERQKALREWSAVVTTYPDFARAFLAQQVVLVEASELGDAFIRARMCKLLSLGFIMPFFDYWQAHCNEPGKIVLPGVIECLSGAIDPSQCLSLPHEGDFFNDPLAGERVPPSAPPIGPRATRGQEFES